MEQSEGKIYVSSPYLPEMEEYIEELRGIWQARWLTNNGGKHRRLESEIKEYLSAPYLALFANGHLALEALLKAALLLGGAEPPAQGGPLVAPPAKNEVITTPFTFVSTVNAVVNMGLTPVFCDVRPDDFTMCPRAAAALMNERTAAILPVHVYGNICDAEAFAALGAKHGVPVIYDAAHAFGVRREGAPVAALGDASMFSFHATKVFHTVEGGAAAVNSPALLRALEMLKNHGLNEDGQAELSGANGKMSEFHASMGLCCLRGLEGEIDKRKAVASLYRERLGGVKGLRLNPVNAGTSENFAYFPIIFEKEFDKTRDEVFAALNENGVVARKYFYPAVNEHPYYASRFGAAATPVAADLSRRVLTLPLHGGVSLNDAERICGVVTG
ncbi:MAG: DegT/DnrJ/EryC1/StrS family aminotransferase [Clostridiales Family XIII bacterium]|jgi:dTDP-4-amino-4,6-dideoxygalactose transaminase|nr:DegT/DnrJ/EryC1/StrS family aminotransferase [Clostridiales Family XIII bacterium]